MSKDRWLGGARALLEAAAKIGLRLLNLEVACRVTVRVQEQLPQAAAMDVQFFFRDGITRLHWQRRSVAIDAV